LVLDITSGKLAETLTLLFLKYRSAGQVAMLIARP